MPNIIYHSTDAQYPLTATDAGGGSRAWTNPNNAKLEDGAEASCGVIGPGGGGGTPNVLRLTDFGFAIPTNAVIDGIKLEIKVRDSGTGTQGDLIQLRTSSVTAGKTNTAWGASLEWLTFGGSTDTWGRTWTPAEVNGTDFGANINNNFTTGTGDIFVDAVRITVFWHYDVTVSAADVPKRYVYKVYKNDNTFLGNLANVKSEFGFSQDINSSGSQLTIECSTSPDTAALESDYLITEDGDRIITEDSEYLRTEGQPAVIALGSNTTDNILMKNGNRIVVWEYSYYYPNGKAMFSGQINRIEAGFGEASDTVKLQVFSDGQEFDNFIARGSPFIYTTDVSQTSQDTFYTISQPLRGGWQRVGQTWRVGTGVTNLGAISLMVYGIGTIFIDVYRSTNAITPIGSTSQGVNVGSPTVIQFGFPSLITTTPGEELFFTVRCYTDQSFEIYYSSTDVYSNGQRYTSVYGGGSGGGEYNAASGDLYFVAASGTASTAATYSSVDPSTGFLQPIIDDYVLRGGRIDYNSGSIDATGVTVTYSINTQTVYEIVKKALELAPSGFYWWVDLGEDILYFKNASSTPDYTLIKGRHLQDMNLVMTIENVKNKLYFSGGPTAGVNLYKEYNDVSSQSLYGTRTDRKSDNRVTVAATANTIGDSFLDTLAPEKYETRVAVLDRTMDITLLTPGKIIGFNGFGTFIDSIQAQIVRREYHPKFVALTLGILPLRLTPDMEDIRRGLILEQTLSNPSTPS